MGSFAQLVWSGTQNFPTGGTINQNIVLTGDVTINVGTDWYLTINGTVSGNFSITKTGSGWLRFTNAANTYTGSTNIQQGFLMIFNEGNLTATSGVVLSAGTTFRIASNTDLIFSRPISGAGEVIFSNANGARNYYLTANNTYTGGTFFAPPGVNLHLGNNTPAGSITGNIEIPGNFILTFNRSNDYTHTGIILGTGRVEKKGSGTTTLTAINTYTGTTSVDAGILRISDPRSLGSTNSIIQVWGGAALEFFASTGPIIFSRRIDGPGSVRKTGSNLLALTSMNFFSGPVSIIEGELLIDWEHNLGIGTSPITISSGAMLDITSDNNITLSRTIAGAGRLSKGGSGTLNLSQMSNYTGNIDIRAGIMNISQSAALSLPGVISGAGGLIKSGTGRLTLTGANTYRGITNIEAGILQVGNGTSGSIQSTASLITAAGTTIEFNPGTQTAAATFDKNITGAANIVKSGANPLTLSGANTFTGTTTVNGGTLQVNAANGLGNATSAITVASGATLRFSPSADMNFSRVISGAGAVEKAGAGTLILSAENPYTGATTVTAGTLQITTLLNIGAAANNTAVAVSSGATLRFVQGTMGPVVGFTRVINGAGNFAKAGAGVLEMQAANGVNDYTGSTTVEAGTMRIIDARGAGNTTTAVRVLEGATLSFGAFGPTDWTFARGITGAGGISKNVPNTVTLSGSLTYTGTTNIANGTFVINATAPQTLTGAFIGSGALRKTGDASLTLNNAANIATGTLTLENGNLTLTNWAGDLVKETGASLTLNANNVAIGGNLTLRGGEVNMTIPAGKLTVAGSARTETAPVTFNVTANDAVTDYPTIEAEAGFTNQANTFINLLGGVFGMDYIQSSNATQLLLTILQLVPVTDIIDVPAEIPIGTPLTLTATVIPSNATNQTIIWSLANDGGTNSTITGATLTATASGIATIRATIINGTAVGTNFVKEFQIKVGTGVGIDAETQSIASLQWRIENGKLKIENGQLKMENEELRVEIYDMTGKRIILNSQFSILNSIDVSHLPNGVYILRVGNQTARIVVSGK